VVFWVISDAELMVLSTGEGSGEVNGEEEECTCVTDDLSDRVLSPSVREHPDRLLKNMVIVNTQAANRISFKIGFKDCFMECFKEHAPSAQDFVSGSPVDIVSYLILALSWIPLGLELEKANGN